MQYKLTSLLQNAYKRTCSTLRDRKLEDGEVFVGDNRLATSLSTKHQVHGVHRKVCEIIINSEDKVLVSSAFWEDKKVEPN